MACVCCHLFRCLWLCFFGRLEARANQGLAWSLSQELLYTFEMKVEPVTKEKQKQTVL